jgi:DNA-binding transcriptional LysR family regulator
LGEAEFVVQGRDEGRALGSGEAEFVVFRSRGRVRALGSGEAEFVVRGRDRGRALGSGEAELPMAPEAGLGCCQPHSVEWHSSRSDVDGSVLSSGRSVERRSDCGHFGSVDWRARVRIRCQAILALNASAMRSVGVAIWPRLLLGEDWASGEPKVCPLLEGALGRDVNPPGSAALCPRLGSGEARSCPLSGPSLDLIAPIRPLQLCADGVTS